MRTTQQPSGTPRIDPIVWEVALGAAGVGVFDWNLTTGVLTWDDRLLHLFGYDRDGFTGRIEAFYDRLHPEDAERVADALRHAVDQCGEYEAEYRVVLPDGTQRWVAARGRVLCETPGTPARLLGAVHDTTAHRAADAHAVDVLERAAARTRLLAEVNAQLDTLDVEVAVGRLARIFVPTMADWSLVTVVDGDGGSDWRRGLRDLGRHHGDDDRLPLVNAYATTRLAALTDDAPLGLALRSGRPIVVNGDAARRFLAGIAPGPAATAMAALAPDHAVVIPLQGRDRVIGLVSLYRDAGRRPFTDDDLAGVFEATTRAGLALDNARLYAQQRQVAEDLQRALLTAPPEPDHMQIVVRYVAAAEAAQVGGDWYDAFLQRDGATVLVIGDVVGHDTDAAAGMGQLRSILRGIAAFSGLGPAGILQGVDESMLTLQIETTATAVVARFEQSAEERRRGVTYLRWSNAGHPTPMVINPDSSILALGDLAPDLLLGVAPHLPRHESRVALDHGSTVLLYTDGLVERRDQPVTEGMERLRRLLGDVARLSLDDLCDAVLERMLPERPEDDVAIVAVRLHDPDRPRPPEAGPRRIPDVVPPEPEV